MSAPAIHRLDTAIQVAALLDRHRDRPVYVGIDSFGPGLTVAILEVAP